MSRRYADDDESGLGLYVVGGGCHASIVSGNAMNRCVQYNAVTEFSCCSFSNPLCAIGEKALLGNVLSVK